MARGRVLFKLAELVRKNAAMLAELETRNCGKPIVESEFDMNDVATCFEYFGGLATKIHGETLHVPDNALNFTLREPVGVAALIIPWNYPLLMAAWKLGPALAAGCAVILKPAEQTPLTALEFAKLVHKNVPELPPGAFNVITGDAVAGRALVESPFVDKVAFTGGADTGKAILRSIGSTHLKKVSLELGGKSPNIFFADADLNAATDGALFGVFINQGEVCSAGSRVLVQQDIFKKFMDRMKEKTKRIKLGDPRKRETKMGPLVSEEHLEKVTSYIEIGKREAQSPCGRRSAQEPEEGLLRRADDFCDRQHHAHRSRGNLRPRRRLHSVQGRSRRAEDRQRHSVWPRRRRVVARHLQVPARREESPRRHRLGQHHAALLRRIAVGRLQSQRPGPRTLSPRIDEFLERRSRSTSTSKARSANHIERDEGGYMWLLCPSCAGASRPSRWMR